MQEAGFYSFVDDRTRDTFTLINVQRIVQPVVTYRGSEGCLGGDKKFIARPIRKGADGEEFSFCTFAISGVAGKEPRDAEGLHSETKETGDIERRSRAVR